MERAEERDHAVTPRVPAGEFQRAFGQLPPLLQKNTFFGVRSRAALRQLFREVDLRAVVEIGAAHVNEFRGLILNRRDDFRVAVPGVGDRDSGGEIEEQVAVNVLNDAPAPVLDEQRVRGRVRRRNELFVACE